jgi:hypothetical protein
MSNFLWLLDKRNNMEATKVVQEALLNTPSHLLALEDGVLFEVRWKKYCHPDSPSRADEVFRASLAWEAGVISSKSLPSSSYVVFEKVGESGALPYFYSRSNQYSRCIVKYTTVVIGRGVEREKIVWGLFRGPPVTLAQYPEELAGAKMKVSEAVNEFDVKYVKVDQR